MADMVDKGYAKFYHYGNTVFYVVRQTQFVAEIHMFSQEKSFAIVRHLKQFLKDFWQETEFIKLEATFPHKSMCALAKRAGFNQEGIRKKSFMLQSGKLEDKYLFGVSRWEQ